MAKVVNLNRVRKQKLREARERQADANARTHGRTKSQKAGERLERARQEAALEGLRRETDETEGR